MKKLNGNFTSPQTYIKLNQNLQTKCPDQAKKSSKQKKIND